ncbi:unnamed protein product [Boreogadus saida]
MLDPGNGSALVLTLHGFNATLAGRQVLFAASLLLYGATVLANLTVVLIVAAEKSLHEPMYVFLCSLCVSGVYGASGFYPKLLGDLLADGPQLISYGGCLAQVFAVYSYVFCEFTNLAVMAYDRYVAICRPLQYRRVMTRRRVAQLLLLTWSAALLESGGGVLLTSRLPLCSRRLDKILCTNWEVVKLSCVDTAANNLYGFLLMAVHLLQALLIAVSYAHIVRASRASAASRRKSLRTCLPHVATLAVFTLSLTFDTLFSRYGEPSDAPALSNLMAAEFLVVPPLVNPLVYGMNLRRIHSQLLRGLGGGGGKEPGGGGGGGLCDYIRSLKEEEGSVTTSGGGGGLCDYVRSLEEEEEEGSEPEGGGGGGLCDYVRSLKEEEGSVTTSGGGGGLCDYVRSLKEEEEEEEGSVTTSGGGGGGGLCDYVRSLKEEEEEGSVTTSGGGGGG